MQQSEPKGVYRRGSRWWVRVRVGGVLVRKAAGATLREAIKELRRLQAERPAESPVRGNSPRFDDLARRYLQRVQLTGKTAAIKNANCAVARLIEYFGQRRVASLTADDFRAFQAKRLESVSRESANHDARYLRAVLGQALDEGLIPRLPFRISMLRTPRKLPSALAPAEVARLLDTAGGAMRSLLTVAANTGLRSGELAALRWRDLDLDGATLHVAARDGWSPKSHRDRLVPLNGAALDALREQKSRALDASHDALVFPRVAKRGTAWDAAGLSRAVRAVFERAGLYDAERKPGLHQLRRTFATRALGSGASIETVRQLGGWSGLGVVQRYVTSDDQAKREAVERLAL